MGYLQHLAECTITTKGTGSNAGTIESAKEILVTSND